MMSFNEKLNKQFIDFQVSFPKQPKHLKHLFADYIELISLFSDGFVTKADVLDRLTDEGFDIVEEIDQNIDDEIGSYNSEKDDEREEWINSIFRILEERDFLYGDDYPFCYSQNKIILKENTTSKQKIYLTLLISSNLNLFKILKHDLTSEFETIAYQALKTFLPSKAIVKQFGKQSDYTGLAIEKIKKLAQDLNINVNDFEISNISKGNTQEKGLDIIGWLPYKDKNPNMIVILGQCACGKDWNNKQGDTKRYENYLIFYKLNPLHAMFIPYSLSSNNSNFYQSDDILKGCLLFERTRIIEIIDDVDFLNNLNCNLIIEKCLAYTEDIV